MVQWSPPSWPVLQGVIGLEDTTAEDGGFGCIPGFHKEYESWAQRNLKRKKPPSKTFVKFVDAPLIRKRLTSIPLNKGDVCVWSGLLPHCNTRTTSDRWRKAMYVRYVSAEADHPDAEWHRKVQEDGLQAYKTGERPRLFSLGGKTPRSRAKIEASGYRAPPLSELGSKLIGREAW